MEYPELPLVLWCVLLLLVVLGILGSIGNTVAIIFYSRHGLDTSTTALILALSGVDLVNSSVLAVLDIIGMFGLYEKIGCIITNYLIKTLFYVSFLLLLGLSIDRFRKICHPFAKQFTTTQGRWFAGISGILGLVLASPIIFTSDIQLIKNSTSYMVINDQNVTSLCRQIVPGEMETVHWIATCIDVAGFLFTLGGIVITNTCVIVNIRRVNLNKHRMMSRQHNHSHNGISDNGPERANTPKGVHKLASTEKILSFMTCCMTSTFIACLIPYFVIEIGEFRNLDQRGDFINNIGVEMAYRSPILSCAINPYITCLFNPQFRLLFWKRFSKGATDQIHA